MSGYKQLKRPRTGKVVTVVPTADIIVKRKDVRNHHQWYLEIYRKDGVQRQCLSLKVSADNCNAMYKLLSRVISTPFKQRVVRDKVWNQ